VKPLKAFKMSVFQRKALPISRHFGGRIIAGNAAEEDQFKWQVGIYIYNEDSEFFCGGALIDTKWILTGARCVDGYFN
jgi:secreted trypsin-like serine protease